MSTEQVFVVTGCNTGLGYHAVKTFAARKSGYIIMACRNVGNANTAADTIAKETLTARSSLIVLPEPCDLSDTASVRSYAKALIKWLEDNKLEINTLVNNAGLGGNAAFYKNKEGNDAIFTANHLGHFLLTLLLLPHITTRIVNVSSEVHDPDNHTSLPDPQESWPVTEEEFNTRLLQGLPLPGENSRTSGGRRYSRSKLCNVFFTNELARRLSGAVPAYADPEVAKAVESLPGNACNKLPNAAKLRVISFNPGLMLDTGFVSNLAGSFAGAIAWAASPIVRLTSVGRLMRPAPLSGERLARLALGEIGGDTTATFFNDEAPKATSVFSRSLKGVTEHSINLWNHSLRWAAVTPEELATAGF